MGVKVKGEGGVAVTGFLMSVRNMRARSFSSSVGSRDGDERGREGKRRGTERVRMNETEKKGGRETHTERGGRSLCVCMSVCVCLNESVEELVSWRAGGGQFIHSGLSPFTYPLLFRLHLVPVYVRGERSD